MSTAAPPSPSAPPLPKECVTPSRSFGPLLLRLHFYTGCDAVAPLALYVGAGRTHR